MAGIDNKRIDYVKEATEWMKKPTISDPEFDKLFKKYEWKGAKNPVEELNRQMEVEELNRQMEIEKNTSMSKDLLNFRQTIEKNVIPKDITWSKESQTLMANYILGTKRGAVLEIKKVGNNANVDMHIFNNWPGSIKIKKSFPISQVDKIPDFIQKTLQSGVQLKTLFGVNVGSPYIPNENLLQKITSKTKSAVKVFTQNVDK